VLAAVAGVLIVCVYHVYKYCLQIATLDFTDAFVRARAHPATVLDTYSVVELWMGTARVYTCYDSLATATVSTVCITTVTSCCMFSAVVQRTVDSSTSVRLRSLVRNSLVLNRCMNCSCSMCFNIVCKLPCSLSLLLHQL
jgi:hypothetical protein